MSAAPPFHLITLGRLALLDAEGHDLLPRDVAKPLALLAFLAAAPGRRCSRERLVDLFWGDSALELGRSSLRQVLYRLREVLGDKAIRSASDELHLTADITTDRDRFLDALDSGDLDAALGLYHGPYVADFVSRGTTQFEQWRDQEQDRLHDLFTNSIEVAGQRAITEGRANDAAALAQRVLHDLPLDERGWRLRLQAEQLVGSRIHLAASVAELRRLFATEGWEPQPRTMQLLDALERTRTATSERARDDALDADLVGRGTLMASLYQHWRHVARRTGVHVHLVGGAGIGKSRVMDDLAVRLRSERGRVATVGAYPRQRLIQSSMLASVIAALAELSGATGIAAESARVLLDLQPTLSTRFPTATPLAHVDGHTRTAAVGEALHDLFEAVTRDGAVCLLLDDAHWWDDESRQVIEAAIERLHDRAILIVTASRPGGSEVSTALTHERVELARWQAEDVLALMQSLGSIDATASANDIAAALCAAAEGVPLLVIEALRLGLDRSLISLADRRWSFAQLPEYLALLRPGQLLRERTSTLTEGQRHLLLVSWLLESEVTADDWHTADRVSHGGTLAELERLGFLTPSGRGWKISHDAIGEAIEAAASADALKVAHRDAGLLSLQRGDHQIVLRQAAKHGAEAGDRSVLQQVAVRWVRQRRLLGATASTAHLLSEVFPDSVSKATITGVTRDLPKELRRRPWSTRRLAPIWAIAGAAVVLGASWLARKPVEPDAILVVYGDNGPERQLPLNHMSWGAGAADLQQPEKSAAGSRWRFTPIDSMASTPMVDPSGTRWIFSRKVDRDGGPTELVLAADGTERILAHGRGDDVAPSWSPDGRFAVFQTTRYTTGPNANFDLAIIDVSSGVLRRLTDTEDGDDSPVWSPEGTRIAFVKRPARLAPDSLCWISIDGRRGACRAESVYTIGGILGWTDSRTIAVMSTVVEGCTLLLVDIDRGTTRILHPDSACHSSLAPDGRWLVWARRESGATGGVSRFAVTSMTGFGVTRKIDASSDLFAIVGAYWLGAWKRQTIDRVSVQHLGDTLYAGTSHRLQLAAAESNGTAIEVPMPVVHWQSSDTTIASIDSTGMLYAHRAGALVITGSAGGWRHHSLPMVVTRADVQSVLEERWSDDWKNRWIAWGAPLPQITFGLAGQPALLVNGDGEYASGTYSRARVNSTRGVALDAQVSTPITRSKWQFIKIGLGSIRSMATGGPTGAAGCAIQYPSGEGWQGPTQFSTPAGMRPADTSVATGRWYTVRIQVFPDRTCGFAINGRAIARTTIGLADRDSMQVSVEGQTVGSPLLIGPVKVWTGVPTDVDWAALRP